MQARPPLRPLLESPWNAQNLMAEPPGDPPEPPQAAQAEQADPSLANSRAHLADRLIPYRWPKGVSGNPAGRPPVSREYEKMLDTTIDSRIARAYNLPDTTIGLTFKEAIAFGQGAAGARGQTDAAREIADRVEGKVESQVRVRQESALDSILRELWVKKMGTAPPPALDAAIEIGPGDGDGDGQTEQEEPASDS